MTVHILLLNLNRKTETIACIESILKSVFSNYQIHLLDNGSTPSQLGEILAAFSTMPNLHGYRSEANLGFAAGNNLLLDSILPGAADDDLILFLNNDTEIEPDLLAKMSAAIDRTSKTEMVAARMMQWNDHSKIDNLGLAVYLSGIGGSRRDTTVSTLFGPCGGCALYTVHCLKIVHEPTGYYFDPSYFCYVEDTDLAWRALLIGFQPAYVLDAVCYHHGGATTGGQFNDFVRYHTIRNTLSTLVKDMPAGIFLRCSFWILLFQITLFFRSFFPLKYAAAALRAYGSFFKRLPQLWAQRRKIMKGRCVSNGQLWNHFTQRPYEPGYLKRLRTQD